MIIFPDLSNAEVEGIEVAEEITLTLRTVSPTALCPSCGTASSRIQSCYTRQLRDLPSVGRPLRLIMHVRRFFCTKSTCGQKIFVERLPDLCHPHAQRTKRLQEALRHLGLMTGGQAGADLGSELGISGSRDTILRLLRQSERSAQPEPHVIGLDDWAWKRRLRYGTLICDLERGLPIDLLPDRTVETVEAWLRDHPSIDVVSRDGSAEYASAIKKGAPQARQVSDRWHQVREPGSLSLSPACPKPDSDSPPRAGESHHLRRGAIFTQTRQSPKDASRATHTTRSSSRAAGSVRAHHGALQTRNEEL